MSNTTKVQVERYVEQVIDDIQYKGHITIAGTKFEYELKFAIPISKLDDAEQCKTPEDVRKRFLLTIKRNGTAINLTDDEYGFFYQMLVEFAAIFYNNPQTRAYNSGHSENLRGMLGAFGASMSSGLSSEGSFDFPPALCETLRSPKFGCAIAA